MLSDWIHGTFGTHKTPPKCDPIFLLRQNALQLGAARKHGVPPSLLCRSRARSARSVDGRTDRCPPARRVCLSRSVVDTSNLYCSCLADLGGDVAWSKPLIPPFCWFLKEATCNDLRITPNRFRLAADDSDCHNSPCAAPSCLLNRAPACWFSLSTRLRECSNYVHVILFLRCCVDDRREPFSTQA